MAWTIEWSKAADKDLEGLGSVAKRRVIDFMEKRVAASENPHQFAQRLTGGKLDHLYKFRVGDYRVIAAIEDNEVKIVAVAVGHRREVYR